MLMSLRGRSNIACLWKSETLSLHEANYCKLIYIYIYVIYCEHRDLVIYKYPMGWSRYWWFHIHGLLTYKTYSFSNPNELVWRTKLCLKFKPWIQVGLLDVSLPYGFYSILLGDASMRWAMSISLPDWHLLSTLPQPSRHKARHLWIPFY